MVEDPAVDMLFITSKHMSHADYAVAGLEQRKAVHTKKAHLASVEQLEPQVAAIEATGGRVALGFNRPDSELGHAVKAHTWLVVGHELAAGHLSHREEEGGHVLGNLSHWTDSVLPMVPQEGRSRSLSRRRAPSSPT